VTYITSARDLGHTAGAPDWSTNREEGQDELVPALGRMSVRSSSPIYEKNGPASGGANQIRTECGEVPKVEPTEHE